MIIVTARWQAKAGKAEDLKLHLTEMVNEVRENEPDCLEYILQQKQGDASQFLFYEQYKNAKAFEFHKQTEHFKNLNKQTEALLEKSVDVETFELVI